MNKYAARQCIFLRISSSLFFASSLQHQIQKFSWKELLRYARVLITGILLEVQKYGRSFIQKSYFTRHLNEN